MTIYTGRGDEGETDLRDLSRVSKTNPRIEAYGVVDEANSLIGTARPSGYDDVDGEWQLVSTNTNGDTLTDAYDPRCSPHRGCRSDECV